MAGEAGRRHLRGGEGAVSGMKVRTGAGRAQDGSRDNREGICHVLTPAPPALHGLQK